MTEVRLISILVVVIGLLGGGLLLHHHGYTQGHTAGAASVQLEWDQNKADIQHIADTAIATATKERDAALQANEVAQNGYQAQLSAANASAADFAVRLRRAESRLAASSGTVPKNGSGPGSSDAISQAGDVGLTNALGSALAECSANAAQLDALIVELKPQLGDHK